MSQFINHKSVKKCRVSHACEWCPEQIEAGQPAENYSGKNEDEEMFSVYFHPECHAVCQSYRDETGDIHWEEYEPQLQERGKPYRDPKQNEIVARRTLEKNRSVRTDDGRNRKKAVCECGDWEDQHEAGGECRICRYRNPNPLEKACDKFVFSSHEVFPARLDAPAQKSEPKNYFILLGGLADFSRADGDSLLQTKEGETVVWTAHKNMKPCDEVFFYITAPLSGIVGSGIVQSEIWINEEKDSRWSNYAMAEIKITHHLDHEKFCIGMKTLRGLFPEWKWLRYPRTNTVIPKNVLEPFLELYESRLNNSSKKSNTEKNIKTVENFADYFLRYSADVPADEVSDHQKFSWDCPCQPSVTFDDLNGWHRIIHRSLTKNSDSQEENL